MTAEQQPDRDDEAILAYGIDELTDAWFDAKEKDRSERSFLNQLELWDQVRTGVWIERYKARRRAGAAARSTKGRTPRRERACVGRLVQAERLIAGLTLRRLASITGISRSALSRIETGQSWLSVERATVIANALGISLDAFRPALDRQEARSSG